MSRSGYSDDYDDYLACGRWSAQVASAARGKRGQRFFRDLVAALDAMPEKKLVEGALETEEGAVCALGALGKARGVQLHKLDTENHDQLGSAFDIARQLAAETMYTNDEDSDGLTPEGRWKHVREWAAKKIIPTAEEITTPAPDGEKA